MGFLRLSETSFENKPYQSESYAVMYTLIKIENNILTTAIIVKIENNKV